MSHKKSVEQRSAEVIARATDALLAIDGWRSVLHAPPDEFTPIEFVEAGCTVVLRGYRDKHGFWATDQGDHDAWPCYAVVAFRVLPEARRPQPKPGARTNS